MEIHYDDVHLKKWKAQRKGDFTVLNRVALAHRTKLCMQLELPGAVKDALRRPKDENQWECLEALRKATLLAMEGEEYVILDSQEQAEELAIAIEQCQNSRYHDEVGDGSSKLPKGSRVRVEGAETREDVAKTVRGMAGDGYAF